VPVRETSAAGLCAEQERTLKGLRHVRACRGQGAANTCMHYSRVGEVGKGKTKGVPCVTEEGSPATSPPSAEACSPWLSPAGMYVPLAPPVQTDNTTHRK